MEEGNGAETVSTGRPFGWIGAAGFARGFLEKRKPHCSAACCGAFFLPGFWKGTIALPGAGCFF
jgi:hypothetical protein